jgi:hypothetical protein
MPVSSTPTDSPRRWCRCLRGKRRAQYIIPAQPPSMSTARRCTRLHYSLAETARRCRSPCRKRFAVAANLEHHTPDEVEALIEATKGNRYGHRDGTIDPAHLPARAPVVRGLRSALGPDRLQRRGVARQARQERHPEHSPDPRRLASARRRQRESGPSPFVFFNERGSPFTTAGFARMIERRAAGADLELTRAATPRQQGARHPGDPTMARAPIDHQRRHLYSAGAEPVQGLLTGMKAGSRSGARSKINSLMSLPLCRRAEATPRLDS